MAKQDDQTTITNSSIALLQKRFRELERMKIIRQERELMRMLFHQSQSQEKYRHQKKFLQHSHHYHHKKQPKVQKIAHQSEIVELKPIPSIQLSLSFWPETEKKEAVFHRPNAEAPPSPSMAKSWLTDHDADGNKTYEKKRDIEDVSFSDVDTSLHL